MSIDTQPCAVPACGVKIPAGLLMCKTHWRRVPAALKAEVNESWRLLRRCRDRTDRIALYARHDRARRLALDAVAPTTEGAPR